MSQLQRLFHPHSLSGRLTLASCLLLPIILGLTSFILERAFNESLESSYREQLQLQTFVLMGAAEAGGGELWMPAILQEPRFTHPNSGLYGLITNPDGKVLWQSPSALGVELPAKPPQASEQTTRHGRLPNGWFYFSYQVIWETEDGRETPFIFTSYETPSLYHQELVTFRWHLWSGLGLLAVFLLSAQILILRWGLHPLNQVASDLRQIEQGKANLLQGDYPHEISHVTDNLNLLLETEKRQRQRYHDTLADLAHSLKTPLAVLRNKVDERHDEELDEQIQRMDQIISHQLNRATQQSAHQLFKPVSIKHCVERIGNALGKVYQDKSPQFSVRGNNLQFKGDERDLMEMLGNLLDNAFKYGQGQVAVDLSATTEQLLIRIEDDGPGVSDSLSGAILNRGTRADNLQPGQGIGLSVVRDILSAYKGELHIETSALGGAAFCLQLPR